MSEHRAEIKIMIDWTWFMKFINHQITKDCLPMSKGTVPVILEGKVAPEGGSVVFWPDAKNMTARAVNTLAAIDKLLEWCSGKRSSDLVDPDLCAEITYYEGNKTVKKDVLKDPKVVKIGRHYCLSFGGSISKKTRRKSGPGPKMVVEE